MDQLALEFANGVRAQALKSTAKGKMDKVPGRLLTPRSTEMNQVAYESTNIQNPVHLGQTGLLPGSHLHAVSDARHKKIKDPYIMQQLLDRERARVMGKVEIPTSYSLEPPPFANPRQTPTLPAAKGDSYGSFTMSAKERTELSSINRQLEGYGQAGPSIHRQAYASGYGLKPRSSPYDDEVDIMADLDSKYQEISHWYSRMEKPDEENLEVLKKLNHDRLSALQVKYKTLRTDEAEVSRINRNKSNFDADFIKNSVVERSAGKRGVSAKSKAQFVKEFEGYLHAKRGGSKDVNGRSFLVDFDRYECTSPDPKRVEKGHTLLYKENV